MIETGNAITIDREFPGRKSISHVNRIADQSDWGKGTSKKGGCRGGADGGV